MKPPTLYHRVNRLFSLAGPSVRIAALAWIALSSGSIAADAATIRSDHDDYYPGERIQITFTDGPGNTKDWIGVYPPEAAPGPVASTIWQYVDGTQAGAVGIKEGTLVFPNGLSLAGDWWAYFFVNDSYTRLDTNLFRVIDPSSPALRIAQRRYAAGEFISVSFTNGPAGAKDWIGVYKVGQVPGSSTPSTVWAYVDGTQTGTTGKPDGTLMFPTGLATAGEWVAHFLGNDSYDILASETFTVLAPASVIPRILSLSPATGSSNLSPVLEFSASITNGSSKLVPASVELLLDGTPMVPQIITENGLVRIRYTGSVLVPAGSEHVWVLSFQDDATPPNPVRAETRGVVRNYRNIVLSNPLVFENFDAVPEGSLPAGWTEKGYSTPIHDAVDFGDLGSATFRTWTAVDADRFKGSFVTYGNPDNPAGWGTDYQRVLTSNPANVVNGVIYPGPFAQGRFLIGNSGYQNASSSQVMFLFTPDFNLSGKTNIHLGFKSLWEQNQDSIATLEYSINGGSSWLPIAYFINAGDLITTTNEVTGAISLDVETTLTTEYADVARYIDEEGNELGGTYGAFVAAPISPALAPYIQGRIDDNASESKRVEWFRLPEADNQATVRFRFGHAGADSWYFGIDDFGIYAPTSESGTPPMLNVARRASDLTLSWPADATGYVLETKPSLATGAWQAVPGVTGNSHDLPATGAGAFYRLRR